MLNGVCCWAQDGPGLYNEDAWEALDRVLDEARRAGLKVMLSFLDNWKYIGEPGCPCQHHLLQVEARSAKAVLESPRLLRGEIYNALEAFQAEFAVPALLSCMVVLSVLRLAMLQAGWMRSWTGAELPPSASPSAPLTPQATLTTR